MTAYKVTGIDGKVDFNPATVVEEVLQNVRTILSTPKFSVPLDRNFGISGDLVDAPINDDTLGYCQSEVVAAVQTYEPRAQVTSVSWEAAMDGKLRPTVTITIEEGDD